MTADFEEFAAFSERRGGYVLEPFEREFLRSWYAENAPRLRAEAAAKLAWWPMPLPIDGHAYHRRRRARARRRRRR